MISLPTINPLPPDAFDYQWDILKTVVKSTGLNLDVVNEVMDRLLKFNRPTDHGSITIIIVGGQIQGIKTEKQVKINKSILNKLA